MLNNSSLVLLLVAFAVIFVTVQCFPTEQLDQNQVQGQDMVRDKRWWGLGYGWGGYGLGYGYGWPYYGGYYGYYGK
jgi:hypothetical protein